jgi:alpha-L-fucosidase
VIDGFKMKVFDSSLEVLVTKRIGKKRDIVLLVSDGPG